MKPILDSINTGVAIFRKNNFEHIVFQDFSERLIKKSTQFNYLFSLFPYRDDYWLETFTKEALKIFMKDRFIKLKSHINVAIEVKLGLTNDEKIIHKLKTNESGLKDSSNQNIAELGKGTANLIGLILKVYSVLFDRKDSDGKKKLRQVKGQQIWQKLIIVEEPEVFLHPDWQSKLADFFVYCMNYNKKNDIKFIIETHSEYLIRKL